MRVFLAPFLLLVFPSCTPDGVHEEIESLEMRVSGWSSLDIVIDNQGNGTFRDSEPHPDGTTGHFELNQAQLAVVLARLQPFREQSVRFSDESAMEFMERSCPNGVSYVTDNGAFYARWITADSDTHYLADFGCDHEQFAARNRELRGIIEGIPIQIDR